MQRCSEAFSEHREIAGLNSYKIAAELKFDKNLSNGPVYTRHAGQFTRDRVHVDMHLELAKIQQAVVKHVAGTQPQERQADGSDLRLHCIV